jgi:hypothetical protein
MTTLPIVTPPTTPTWFTRWLANHTNPERGSRGRHASLQKCPQCKARTLTGDDSPIAALTVRIDPTPLTPETELACLLAGRRTYLLEGTTARVTIHHRDRWQTRGLPPGPNIVVPAHQCSARFPDPPLPKGTRTHDCPF